MPKREPLYPHVPKRKEPQARGQKYIAILDKGDTIFQEGETVSPEAYEKENERVSKLGLRTAYGKHLGDIIPPQRVTQTESWQKSSPQTSAYNKELEQLRQDLRDGAISKSAYQKAVKEVLAKKHKPYRSDVTVRSWQERDRLGIWITDKRTGKTIAEWWDEDAREMFEQGFFKPGVPQYSWEKPGRDFVESVLDYAESVGMLAKA